jgi:hypothetical protein
MGDFVVDVDSQLAEHTNDLLGGTRTIDCGMAPLLYCSHVDETSYLPFRDAVRDAITEYTKSLLPTAVAVTTTSIGDVKLGTPANEAERRLRALLGRPDRVLDGGCTLYSPSEHARYLTWGSLTTSLSDRAPGSVGQDVVTKALMSWRVGQGRSHVELKLPHGIKTSMSSVEVRTRATITRSGTDLAGNVSLTDRDGVEYDFDGVNEPTTLRSISYQVTGCE